MWASLWDSFLEEMEERERDFRVLEVTSNTCLPDVWHMCQTIRSQNVTSSAVTFDPVSLSFSVFSFSWSQLHEDRMTCFLNVFECIRASCLSLCKLTNLTKLSNCHSPQLVDFLEVVYFLNARIQVNAYLLALLEVVSESFKSKSSFRVLKREPLCSLFWPGKLSMEPLICEWCLFVCVYYVPYGR